MGEGVTTDKLDAIVDMLRECQKDANASEGDYYADQFAFHGGGEAADAIEWLRAEIARLRDAIRRLAEQDATLSLLCKRDGSQVVTVTIDATLTDEELRAVRTAAFAYAQNDDDEECAWIASALLGLAERCKQPQNARDHQRRGDDMDNEKNAAEPSGASGGYAVQPMLIERAFREVIESANEASRAHAMNYAGLITALLTKGVISAEELEAGRQQAKPLVDEHFGPTPEQKRSEELAKLLNALGRKA